MTGVRNFFYFFFLNKGSGIFVKSLIVGVFTEWLLSVADTHVYASLLDIIFFDWFLPCISLEFRTDIVGHACPRVVRM